MKLASANRITQTAHGASRAVDISASPDTYVYAPEDATFDSYMQRGTGTSNAGNALRIRGKTGLHQFAHLEESYVTGGTVVKGQRIAKMGYTGYTIPSGKAGKHLHWWVKTPSGYVYPPNLVNETFNQGDTMNQEAGTELYRTALFREPESVAGASQWNGQAPAHALRAVRGAEWQSVKARLEAYPKLEQAIRDLETALANEKNKPPQVVEKIVEKIVTKNVEIIKEIERIVEIEPSWVVKVRDFIKAFLKLK